MLCLLSATPTPHNRHVHWAVGHPESTFYGKLVELKMHWPLLIHTETLFRHYDFSSCYHLFLFETFADLSYRQVRICTFMKSLDNIFKWKRLSSFWQNTGNNGKRAKTVGCSEDIASLTVLSQRHTVLTSSFKVSAIILTSHTLPDCHEHRHSPNLACYTSSTLYWCG